MLMANVTNDTSYSKLFRIYFDTSFYIYYQYELSEHQYITHCTAQIYLKKKKTFGQFPKKNMIFPFTKTLCVISSFNKSIIPQAVMRMTFISILNQCIILMFCLEESRASLSVCF